MWFRAAVAASARAAPRGQALRHLRHVRQPLAAPARSSVAPQGLGAAFRACPPRHSQLGLQLAPACRAFASKSGDDPYEALGVQRNALQDDIKSAYRKLALKWHPDRNPDNQKKAEFEFKRISKAYSLLSDPEQRAMYDRFGTEDMSGGGAGGAARGRPMTEAEAAELFKQMFGNKTLDEIIREVELSARKQSKEMAAQTEQLRNRVADLRAEAEELEARALQQRMLNPLRSAQLIMLSRRKAVEANQADQAYQMSLITRFNQQTQANWTLSRLRSMDPVHQERRRIGRFVSWGVAIGALLIGFSWSGTFLLFLATSFMTRFVFALVDQARK